MEVFQLKKKHFPTNPNANWTYGPNIENRDTPPLTGPPPPPPSPSRTKDPKQKYRATGGVKIRMVFIDKYMAPTVFVRLDKLYLSY